MADGIRCKHCGWQETEHGFVGVSDEEANKVYRKMSLRQCMKKKRFTPENPRLAKKLASKERGGTLVTNDGALVTH
jgi:hypothetical protein